jgi:hypothetical protein
MPDKKDALAKSPTAITKQPLTLDQLMQLAEVEVDEAKIKATIDAMSFSELNDFIVGGVKCVIITTANIKQMRRALTPAVVRLHGMCAGQGKRNDLTGGVTWTAICLQLESLGSKRTWDSIVEEADLFNPNKMFPINSEVKLLGNGDDRPFSHIATITAVHEKTNPTDDAKVDVSYKTLDETGKEVVKEVIAVRTNYIEKLPKAPKVLALEAGTLVILLDIDGGSEFLYEGDGKITRTETPSVNDARKFALDEKEVARAARKREADAKIKADREAAKEERRIASEKKRADKAAQAAADKAKIAANKAEAASAPKKPRSKRTVTAVESIVRELGGKFFLFAKDEAGHSISGASKRSSGFDTKAEAEALALKLNINYGFIEAAETANA